MKTTPRRTPGGRLKKGASGNPTGRPPGSRNQATLAFEQQLLEAGPGLMNKTIELAKAGNVQALRFCLDRFYPVRRDSPVDLALPPIQNAQDMAAAFTKITEAVATSQMTPAEGESLAQILTLQGEALLASNFEKRLEALEKSDGTYKAYRKEIAEYRQSMLDSTKVKTS
jgi:uncharacterized protein DUF5681